MGVRAFDEAPKPCRIIATMLSAVHAESRIERPLVRKGRLKHGIGSSLTGRSVEPFVAVPWDEALDLVAAELKRVKATYDNVAIYAVRAERALACSTMPRPNSIAL